MPFSLYDFRDSDIMFKLAEEGDDEGWVQTRAMASALGVDEDDRINGVGIRLSWMRRYGFLDYDGQRKLWRLSQSGARITESKLRAAAAKTIDEVPDESLVEVMAHVTTRFRLGDPVMAQMLMREFRYGTDARSKVWRE